MNTETENFMGNTFVWWQGVVEDTADPLKLGRCRVRILGFHSENRDEVVTEHLPWASVIQPINSAAMNGIGLSPTGILSGTWVIGFFRDGNSAQEPIIMGTLGGIPTQAADGTKGFQDPKQKYPKQEFLNEPDTNRLARNEKIAETVVQIKKTNLEKSVFAALNAETWTEPETPYAAEYPKNHVYETESGHIQEFDDTPNKERIHTYHKSGTFQEIHPKGDKVTKIVGSNYEIIVAGDKVLIKGDSSTNVNGNNNQKVGKNLNIHILGDCNILVNGNSTMETKGNHFHKIGGACGIVSEGNMVLSAPRIDFNPVGIEPSSISSPF